MHLRTPNRATLIGATWGRGSTGVVLAHQSDGDLCQWTGFAAELARRGLRVLAFDFEGHGASTQGRTAPDLLASDVLTAVRRLRADGARRVVAIGASMGGTAVLSAASQGPELVSGVVSLSGPESIFDTDVATSVARIRVPILLVAGASDGDFADSARLLFGRARAPKRLILEPGSDHGVELAERAVHPKVVAGMFALVKRVDLSAAGSG